MERGSPGLAEIPSRNVSGTTLENREQSPSG